MNENEYFDKLIVEYKRKSIKDNKEYISYLIKCIVFFLVLSIVGGLLFYLKKNIDGIFGVVVGVFFLIILLFYIICVFSFLFNIVEIIHLIFYRKKILNYLTKKKTFKYKSVIISKEIFDFSLTFAGFMAMYTIINDRIYYLEAQLKKIAAPEEKAEIGDCYVNFSDALNLDEFLNYEIGGVKIRDIECFELLSVNYGDPAKFIDEYNEFSS